MKADYHLKMIVFPPTVFANHQFMLHQVSTYYQAHCIYSDHYVF